MTDHRCHRGDRCPDSERLAGGTVLGKPINAADGLCDTCERTVTRAIRELPWDYTELHLSLGAAGRDTGQPLTGTRDTPMPINAEIEALQATMVHEALCWAESIAEVLGVDWDTQHARDSRPGANLGRCCALLVNSLPVLLALRDVEHLGWIAGNRAILARDGIDGALVLLSLHGRARYLLGQTRLTHRLPAPCPRCERVALEREDGSDTITCTACSRAYTWAEYEEALHHSHPPQGSRLMARKQPPDPWPWPADNPLERARRIARSYRDALHAHNPDECEHLDKRAAELGQGWVVPQLQTVDLDDLLTTEQAADFCNVKPRTVDQWRRRGLKPTHTPDGLRYRVADILDYHAERRRRRVA